MSADIRIAAGDATGEEAAAVAAAVQVLLEAEATPGPSQPPWPYRSAWRRAAIDEGVDR